MSSGSVTDLLIIGAGPAGLAAAVQARELGLTVTVFDEQATPGGQAWCAIESMAAEERVHALGASGRRGLALVRAFRSCGARWLGGHTVWHLDAPRRVFASDGRASHVHSGRAVLIAVGAMERAVPLPGWTLPGVMTVGAAQRLWKASGVVPGPTVWIAGSGPLVVHHAAQLVRQGVRLAGWLDTSRRRQHRAALQHAWGALRGAALLAQGLADLALLHRRGPRRHSEVEAVEVVGARRVEAVRWRVAGHWYEDAADGVLLHEGVVPQSHLAQAVGCKHDWHTAQRAWAARCDAFGRSSVAGVWIAGDAGGIVGEEAAAVQGQLAALGVATALERIGERECNRRSRLLLRASATHQAPRRFLDVLYAPREAVLAPADDVLLCRCEAVRAGRVRALVRDGLCDLNALKSASRCGMGPCQGRLCGLPLLETVTRERGVEPGAIEPLRLRPPFKPVSLGELAALAQAQGSPRGTAGAP